MSIKATIIDIQKTDTEVTVTIRCADGVEINEETTFTVALTPTVDNDINQVINDICAKYQPVEETIPQVEVTTQVGQVFAFDTQTRVATVQPMVTPPIKGGVI